MFDPTRDAGQPLVVTVDERSEEESLSSDRAEDRATRYGRRSRHGGPAGLRWRGRALSSLKSVIAREAGGRGRVTVVLDLPAREVEIAIPGGFKVDPQTRAAVKSLPGIIDVHDI